MNTPAHLIMGAAAFARPGAVAVTCAALFGSLLPDLSLYLMVAWSMFVLAIPAQVIFDQLYFSEAWQQVFAVDNSFPLWGLVLAFGVWRRSGVIIAFAGAGLLHLLMDFGLHNEDARRQFWPISDWVFRSPFSYWDHRHYGQIIGPLEIGLSVALCVVLWGRFKGGLARGLILALALLEAAPAIIFGLMFAG